MMYVLTNGERSVLVTSKVHRDAYVSSGWIEVAQPEPVEAKTTEEVSEAPTAPVKRRGGRPKREV